MEGVSDYATRFWFYLNANPPFMSTPFLRATDSYPGKLPEKFAPELTTLKQRSPYKLVTQIMASCPEAFSRTAEHILPHTPTVDLNCGCPSPKSVGRRAGASLIMDPDSFGTFLDRIVQNVGPGVLSVKTRLGYYESSEFLRLREVLSHFPLHHLSIHGRTRVQRYSGDAHWPSIMDAGSTLPFPVIGSGDISDRLTFQSRHHPAVAAVMIGRGALRNPWIFLEIKNNRPVHLPYETLKISLASFAILGSVFTHDFPSLVKLVEEGLGESPPLTCSQQWTHIYHKLTHAHLGHDHSPYELPFGGKNLGRVKMLWHYIRSSLSPAFHNPQILRSKNFLEFFQRLDAAYQLHAQEFPGDLELSYQPHLNHLYGTRPQN